MIQQATNQIRKVIPLMTDKNKLNILAKTVYRQQKMINHQQNQIALLQVGVVTMLIFMVIEFVYLAKIYAVFG